MPTMSRIPELALLTFVFCVLSTALAVRQKKTNSEFAVGEQRVTRDGCSSHCVSGCTIRGQGRCDALCGPVVLYRLRKIDYTCVPQCGRNCERCTLKRRKCLQCKKDHHFHGKKRGFKKHGRRKCVPNTPVTAGSPRITTSVIAASQAAVAVQATTMQSATNNPTTAFVITPSQAALEATTTGTATHNPTTAFVITPSQAALEATTMGTDFNGILVQQHFNGTPFFVRDWAEFKVGFGHVSSDYWLGNDRLHNLTKDGRYKLRVDLLDDANTTWYWAEYSTFVVDDESTNYTLHVGGYSGDAGDAMNTSNGAQFSTIDRNNDGLLDFSCVNDPYYGGGTGFWYQYDTGIPDDICADAYVNGNGSAFTWSYNDENSIRYLQISRLVLLL